MAFTEGLTRPHQIDELIADYTGAVSLSDAKAALEADRSDLGRTYQCPKCRGIGTHAKSLDSLNPADTQLIQCTMATPLGITCDGWGYTTVAVKLNPPSGKAEYIEV